MGGGVGWGGSRRNKRKKKNKKRKKKLNFIKVKNINWIHYFILFLDRSFLESFSAFPGSIFVFVKTFLFLIGATGNCTCHVKHLLN